MSRSSGSLPIAGPAPAGPSLPAHSTGRLILASLRPEQWTKNLLVFAGLIFGRMLRHEPSQLRALATFAAFCLVSSAIYLFNDYADRDRDRLHPHKRLRPMASGALSPSVGLASGVVAGLAGLALAWTVGPWVAGATAAYMVVLTGYSFALKHVVIIDALAIATGFVLRAVAGAVAVRVPISHWLLICTTLLALFLALSKRRHELTLLSGDAGAHRRILDEYSPYLLDQMIAVVTTSTLVAYSAYAMSAETAENLGTPYLSVTIPFVLYGIFRYLYLVHRKDSGGSPSMLLLTDRPLLTCVLLWVASVALLLYTPVGQ